ncbi:MAG: alpha-N-arabinofuranosidase [Treponema sp.]|nr:alpha-N-arabinofuranosidase [Treponema sp.]
MKSRITVVKEFKQCQVDDNLFSSFVEHLGRAIYTGIYEPDHPSADEQGFRKDVIELAKELNVSLVRYPGGNFLSNYNWKDGIGPVKDRPVRLDRAWHSIEPNKIGIDEFYDWSKKAGIEILGAVNMGTGSIQDAADFVEYCNYPGGTYWSDLRIKNGHKEPFNIKYWCIGNEMDGKWQIGHMDAVSYGSKAREAAKYMKFTDESIKTVLCGSMSSSQATYPEWDRIVLEESYDFTDYISIHRYFENLGNDDDFLASWWNMENFIKTAIATCDYVKALKRSDRTIYLSFDEWNVWYQKRKEPHPWETAPRILEEHYSLLDALTFGGMAITLLNNADRVKIACLAQLINVIAPIFCEPGKGAYKQAIYYPFQDISKCGRGTLMHSMTVSDKKITEKYGEVPAVIFSSIYNEENDEITLFALNTHKKEKSQTTINLWNFGDTQMISWTELSGPDLSAKNSLENPDAVKPKNNDLIQSDNCNFEIELNPVSWNVIRFKVVKD